MDSILTEHDILRQEDKLYVAIKEGNITQLDELLHDNLLFILPSGETITKQVDLDVYRSGALE
ncbi:MAG: nuclear transport factor 2 family protein, partial [Pedobacter sp.]